MSGGICPWGKCLGGTRFFFFFVFFFFWGGGGVMS